MSGPDAVPVYLLLVVMTTTAGAYLFMWSKAMRLSLTDGRSLQFASQPWQHGAFAAALCGLSGTAVFAVGAAFRDASDFPAPVFDLIWLIALLLSCAGTVLLLSVRLDPGFRSRTHLERLVRYGLMALSAVAVLTTLGIILSLLFEALRFFADVSVFEFIFGTQWSPQTALRADQAGQSGAFGAVPVFAGTLLVTLIAISVAGPIGLMVAIYLSEYASTRTRRIIKPTIEILAGIPTVVYGFFALLTVGPSIRSAAALLGFDVPTQSALAAGLVMGVMIIPLVSSLSDDVIRAVPQSLRDGSYALGATKSETMKRVVFRGALPGIVGAFLLAISRAVGETMIVVMAASRAANLTANPFEAVTTVTVQIVALLTGDQEFDSPKTLAAFALGLVLFGLTLLLNMIALSVVRRYGERFS